MALLQANDVQNSIVEKFINAPANELLNASYKGTFKLGTKTITVPYLSKLTPVSRTAFVPGATPKRMDGGFIQASVGEGIIEKTALPIGNEFYNGGVDYVDTMNMIVDSLDQFRFRWLINSILPTSVDVRLFKTTGASITNNFGATVKSFTLADINKVISKLPKGNWYMVMGKKLNNEVQDLVGDKLLSTIVGADVIRTGIMPLYKGVKVYDVAEGIPMTTAFGKIAETDLKMDNALYPNTTREVILFVDVDKMYFQMGDSMNSEFKTYDSDLAAGSFGGNYFYAYFDRSIKQDGVFALVQG